MSGMQITGLKPGADHELAKQIEALEPKAAVLNSLGFAWQLADYLALVIKNGKVDLSELRNHGVGEKTAVEICEAVTNRHARVAAAVALAAARNHLPPAPIVAVKPQELDHDAALSLLHDLALQLESGRGDITALNRAGWSEPTSREIARVINAARR